MALTEELIKANAATAGLTKEQIDALVIISTNDENATIGKKIGELHGQYDIDIKEVTGIEKAAGEKTYDYNKRVLKDLKEKAGKTTEFTTKITTLEAEKADLEKQIKEGKGSEVIAQKLKDTETRLTQLQSKYDADIAEWQKKHNDKEAEVAGVKISNEFSRHIAGIKIKPEFDKPEIKNVIIDNAQRSVLSKYKTDFIDDGKGGKQLVFRNPDGSIANNPENKLLPYTAGELLMKELPKDIIDGKQQPGVGTHTPTPTPGAALDLSGIKTQVEADGKITEYLMAKGLTRGTQAFTDEQTKIRTDAKVSELPIK